MDRWEFLVICRDAAAYKTITAAVQKVNGAVNYSWNTAGARAYIARRKIDGIFLETALPGALDLIQAIRRGNSPASRPAAGGPERGSDRRCVQPRALPTDRPGAPDDPRRRRAPRA